MNISTKILKILQKILVILGIGVIAVPMVMAGMGNVFSELLSGIFISSSCFLVGCSFLLNCIIIKKTVVIKNVFYTNLGFGLGAILFGLIKIILTLI